MDSSDKTIRVTYWLWLAATTLMLCLLAVVAYDNRQQIDFNTERLDRMIEERTKDRFTATDAREWRAKLRAANPDLIVPEPDDDMQGLPTRDD